MTNTVLITGAEGLIGSYLQVALAQKYTVIPMTQLPLPGLESRVADIRDFNAVLSCFQGVEIIVHLAGSSSMNASWDELLQNNIIGTRNVFEAASQAGVKQVIFASSNRVVGTYERRNWPRIFRSGEMSLDHQVALRPDSLYAVSKCFGEALGRFYADHKRLRVICIRIGSITPDDTPYGPSIVDTNLWLPTPELRYERVRNTWLSKRDFAQLVDRCIEAEQVEFDVFYGVSNNVHHYLDIDHARQVLGYEPMDGAE